MKSISEPFVFFFEVKGRNFIDEKKYKYVTTISELLIRAKFYASTSIN